MKKFALGATTALAALTWLGAGHGPGAGGDAGPRPRRLRRRGAAGDAGGSHAGHDLRRQVTTR